MPYRAVIHVYSCVLNLWAVVGMVALVKSKQEEIDTKKDEKKKRVAAEEATKALRSRVSYLLQQLSALSTYAMTWSSEKTVLQSQIKTLYDVNIELRGKLVHIQRSFMNRHVNELHNRSHIGNSKAAYMTEYMGPHNNDGTEGSILPPNKSTNMGNSIYHTRCADTSTRNWEEASSTD